MAPLTDGPWPATTLPAGTLLFEEGRDCHGFPLLDAGRVRVYKAFPNGRELLLYRLLPGQACVASMGALFAGAPYSLRAVAEVDVTLRLVPPADFRAALGEPAFRDFVLSEFAARMADLLALLDAVFVQRVDQRLAAYLLDHGPACTLTHQQLADELGSVREIVTRVLGHFSERGWVAVERGRVRVLDAGALKEFSEGER